MPITATAVDHFCDYIVVVLAVVCLRLGYYVTTTGMVVVVCTSSGSASMLTLTSSVDHFNDLMVVVALAEC